MLCRDQHQCTYSSDLCRSFYGIIKGRKAPFVMLVTSNGSKLKGLAHMDNSTTCLQCGIAMSRTPYDIKKGINKYCSKKCSGIARRSRIDKQCQHCGKPFTTHPCRIKDGEGKYCSKKCYGEAKQYSVECKCIVCGELFKQYPSGVKDGKGKYCSKDCSTRAHRAEYTCQHCRKEFTLTASRSKDGSRKYCSRHCMHNAKRGAGSVNWRGGNKKSYRGDNWTQQRNLAYNRDQGICQNCGKQPRKGLRQFDVHHIKSFYFFNGDYLSANQLTNLITLCRRCHVKAENGKVAIQPYLL